jgi:hypothetical protein
MAIRMLQREQSSRAILSALMTGRGVSRRQAYRYLSQAQRELKPRPVPEAKAIFTVNLPRRLTQQIRARCRQQRRPISHLVAAALQQWLEPPPPAHGSR